MNGLMSNQRDSLPIVAKISFMLLRLSYKSFYKSKCQIGTCAAQQFFYRKPRIDVRL